MRNLARFRNKGCQQKKLEKDVVEYYLNLVTRLLLESKSLKLLRILPTRIIGLFISQGTLYDKGLRRVVNGDLQAIGR